MVAVNINGLHAHRAGNVLVQHWETQAVADRNAEVAGAEDSVVAISQRWDGRDETARVRLGDSSEALGLAVIWRIVEE